MAKQKMACRHVLTPAERVQRSLKSFLSLLAQSNDPAERAEVRRMRKLITKGKLRS